MKNNSQSKEQIMKEIVELRERIAELEDEKERRRSSEEALRKSEAKYKDFVELLPHIVYELDTHGNFSFLNCRGLEAFGYTSDDLNRGLRALDLVVSEERERLAGSMGRAMQGARLTGAEFTALRKDGTTFPILTYSHPIVRECQAVGLRGVSIDITNLRRVQERLWIKNSAIASSINAIVMTDLSGNMTYVNPAFLKLWDYQSTKDVLGQDYGELWPKTDATAGVMQALLDQGWWTGEQKAKRKDGTSFDVHVSATVITDESGKPVGTMTSFLDITERKGLEEALRSSEERFRAIFEGAGDCILIKDRGLKYTHVNPAVEKLVGLNAQQIIGMTASDIFGEETGERIRDVDLRVLAGHSIEHEQIRRVKGVPLTFHDISVPLRSPYHEIVGVCTISRNITERRNTRPVPCIKVREYPSEAMRATLEKARYAAARDSIVLICGESGSGKDYVAQWIHKRSRRASGPFFAINCAALPQELAESELFGHEPGAFTGARGRKRGLLELAEGGTILLNEIGELSLVLQSKLLTFLDTKSFLRVGGEKSIHINARLIAATHRDLDEEMSTGRFLPALYYRLNVFSVQVPPLREREEDVPILIEEIMSGLATEMQLTEVPVIGPTSLKALKQYLWPGNVRELRNLLERALMLWDKGQFEIGIPGIDRKRDDWSFRVGFPLDRGLREVTDGITESLCREALRRCRGVKKDAARLLGISRNSLYRHMKRVGLPLENGTRF